MRENCIKFSIIFFAAFVIVTFWFVSGKSLSTDMYIYRFVCENVRNENLTKIMLFLTNFASGKYVIILIIILMAIPIDSKRYGFDIGIATMCQITINIALKSIFKRQRIVDNILVYESSYSFPSSHTVTAVIVYGFMIYICSQLIKENHIRILAYTANIIIIILISFSRIYLGAHYFSDVIAGIFLSLSFLMLAISASYSIRKNTICF